MMQIKRQGVSQLSAVPLLIGLIALQPSPTYGLQESRLFLPKKHADLKLKLFKAAKVAEELPNCADVVSGTLHLGMSTDALPVFKIICRNPERRTFTVLMDGVDYVYLNPPPAPEPPPEEESEPEEVIDPALVKLEQEAEYWRLCEAGVLSRSKNMLAVEWLYDGPVPPEYSVNETTGSERTSYQLPFNAKDIQGHSLRFKGVCRFESLEEYEIQLRPR